MAKPVLAADSRAKVQMRRKIRGLRAIEREVLAVQHPPAPPGLRMAEALQEVRTSLQRNLEAQKGGLLRSSSPG